MSLLDLRILAGFLLTFVVHLSRFVNDRDCFSVVQLQWVMRLSRGCEDTTTIQHKGYNAMICFKGSNRVL